jgi:hypothetical protein
LKRENNKKGQDGGKVLSTTGRDKNYKHGRKNQWRRWAWKEIAKRVDSQKTAKVLYLAGRDDLDRAVAVANGFMPENLYAVDKDIKVVEGLKKKGCLALCGDFIEIAIAGRNFFDVFYADFCCGWNDTIEEICALAILSNKEQIVMCNMQRGRDKVNDVKRFLGTPEDEKNRARLLVNNIILKTGNLYAKFWGASEMERILADLIGSKNIKLSVTQEDKLISNYIKLTIYYNLNPAFRTYQGNRVYMDSVVFNTYPLFGGDIKATNRDNYNKLRSLNNKLRSIKAIATMRKNGTLERCPRW